MSVPITLQVRCRTSRRKGAKATRHPVTIHADWSVDTGHDIDSERVAMAFGGYLSCIDLIDRVVPAVRIWWHLRHRLVSPGIWSRDGKHWRIRPPLAKCCPRAGFLGADKAAEHERSLEHQARLRGCDLRQLKPVVRALVTAEVAYQPPDQRLRVLWRAGMHPDMVGDVDRRHGRGEPMSVQFHLAYMTARPPADWVDGVLAELTDIRMMPKLILEYDTLIRNGWSKEWLSLPVPPLLAIRIAADRGYTPDDARRLAASSGGSLMAAATTLGRWCESGVRPDIDELLRLAELGGPAMGRPPSRSAVQRAQAGSSALRGLSRADVALLLAEHGSATGAVRELEALASETLTPHKEY